MAAEWSATTPDAPFPHLLSVGPSVFFIFESVNELLIEERYILVHSITWLVNQQPVLLGTLSMGVSRPTNLQAYSLAL